MVIGSERCNFTGIDSNHGRCLWKPERKDIARNSGGEKRKRTIYLAYHAHRHEWCINRLEERLRTAILFHSTDRKVPLTTTSYLSLTRPSLGVVFNRQTRSIRAHVHRSIELVLSNPFRRFLAFEIFLVSSDHRFFNPLTYTYNHLSKLIYVVSILRWKYWTK